MLQPDFINLIILKSMVIKVELITIVDIDSIQPIVNSKPFIIKITSQFQSICFLGV